MITRWLWVVALFPAALAQVVGSTVHLDADRIAGNKFLQRSATKDSVVHSQQDEVPYSTCSHDLAIKWHARAGSAVYATPLITDLHSDGRRDIIVPAFVNSLEVVEGRGGAKQADFEAFHESTLHTSPLLFDADFDGVQDIVVATYGGEILFFKDNGEEASRRLVIPPLEVRRGWYEGLALDHVDHTRPDVTGAEQQTGGQGAGRRLLSQSEGGEAVPVLESTAGQQTVQERVPGDAAPRPEPDQVAPRGRATRLLAEEAGGAGAVGGQGLAVGAATPPGGQNATGSFGTVAGAMGTPGGQGNEPGGNAVGVEPGAHVISDEAADSYAELFGDVVEKDTVVEDFGSGVKMRIPSLRSLEEGNIGKQERPYGLAEGDIPAGGGVQPADLWEDEEWHAPDHTIPVGSFNLRVDAHVLATPAIADIDGDGHDELVAVVSYFYDRDYYEDERHRQELGLDVDISKYLAVGVIVYDLNRQTVKWRQHLDLSTDQTKFRAVSYSPPTLVDVNGDGKLEVVFGTSVGFLYVLNAVTGGALEGWPVQMGPILGAVVADDINDDGKLELVATDTLGNVAAFDGTGKEVWERHLESAISQSVTLGDVNGDGALEVVVGTASGHIHVMEGATGRDLTPFPYKAGGRIMAPILLVPLAASPSPTHLHLVVLAHDGFLYALHGADGCVEALDLGEVGYAQALADDLDGDGRLELLVASMGGDLYAVATPAPAHPLRAWTAAAQGLPRRPDHRHGAPGGAGQIWPAHVRRVQPLLPHALLQAAQVAGQSAPGLHPRRCRAHGAPAGAAYVMKAREEVWVALRSGMGGECTGKGR